MFCDTNTDTHGAEQAMPTSAQTRAQTSNTDSSHDLRATVDKRCIGGYQLQLAVV
jgi:hypothetical protein